MILVAILVVVFILSGIICYQIAKTRGANAVFWSAMGVAFGPLVIPFVFFARSR